MNNETSYIFNFPLPSLGFAFELGGNPLILYRIVIINIGMEDNTSWKITRYLLPLHLEIVNFYIEDNYVSGLERTDKR